VAVTVAEVRVAVAQPGDWPLLLPGDVPCQADRPEGGRRQVFL